MKFQRLPEFEIDEATENAIAGLLGECFPEYPQGRTYYKQLPDFRFLCWENDALIAHMAVEHRMINNDGQAFRIFGVVDLCVAEAFQHRRLASRMLSELALLGLRHRVDFLLLMAKDHGLYLSNGFQLVTNTCQWLMISEYRTLGIAHRRVKSSLMVKALGKKEWRPGLVDFLGYVF
ncbi:MAG: GNAT family N-acetyltransferase [Phaeodactylibacter sp.]|nr:GNAT family N-acetyltransferase [Phaeodactylibacter sp.]MCB9052181.1 GNAT family N-acetyltransferase [Lewinellaceae bacterium]